MPPRQDHAGLPALPDLRLQQRPVRDSGAQAIDLSKHKDLGQAPWDAISGKVSSRIVVALRPESLPKGDSFKSVLAHEFFHVLQ
jgi:hypothetical protein